MISTLSEVNCPHCKKKIAKYTGARSQYIVCGGCNTVFSDINGTITKEGSFAKKISATLPIGAVGVFDNIKYVVVGLLIANERYSIAQWNEYILYNEDHGYITLSEYERHWNIVKPITNLPPSFKPTMYEGEEYKIFNKYRSFYSAAQGEFTWKVTSKAVNQYAEFIAPPHSIIQEISNGVKEYYQSTYIDNAYISETFKANLPTYISSPNGVYSNQPNVFYKYTEFLRVPTLGFLVGMVLICILQMFLTPSTYILSETVALDTIPGKPDSFKPYVSHSFDLHSAAGHSSVQTILTASLDNTWLEAEVNLVNQETDDEYSTEIGVEYYYGYEDGATWSEGNSTYDKILSMVPDGRYKIVVTPTTESIAITDYKKLNRVQSLNIRLVQNSIITSNYILLILLVCIVPVYVEWRKSLFEQTRWSNSNYEP